jgi:hypothetical protein
LQRASTFTGLRIAFVLQWRAACVAVLASIAVAIVAGPVFLDRLNTAQQVGLSGPGLVFNSVIAAGQSALGQIVMNGGTSYQAALMLRAYVDVVGQQPDMALPENPVTVPVLEDGIVFQDYMNYELSVRENIALGDLGLAVGDEPITAAAARAGIDSAMQALMARGGTYARLFSLQAHGFTNDSDAADEVGSPDLDGLGGRDGL